MEGSGEDREQKKTKGKTTKKMEKKTKKNNKKCNQKGLERVESRRKEEGTEKEKKEMEDNGRNKNKLNQLKMVYFQFVVLHFVNCVLCSSFCSGLIKPSFGTAFLIFFVAFSRRGKLCHFPAGSFGDMFLSQICFCLFSLLFFHVCCCGFRCYFLFLWIFVCFSLLFLYCVFPFFSC